ncbi:Sodium-coupled monocarboxylate transporter 1 [Armadillidium nasatum]|uniref:Sodium-coupled monocarboxylate transporter 1 n=1 Tax=Armadillidium nasatum TaxID=96803 RepID=A0A5N5SJD8_9CRUS|nr:Sodium-coupled monocarboxylate transporter 1 [Armadillidium nasatum]
MVFFCGLVIYATYAGCDPMALRKIKKKDEIMPYFVMDKLSLIPGLPGLFVAAIIGAALSTLSSFINSCVASVVERRLPKFDIFKNTSQIYATFINKILSLVVGADIVLIGLAIIASNTKHLMELGIICGNLLNGPLLGLFLIGYFIPNCNLKGIWTGIVGSTVFTCWLVIGGLIYKKPTKMLPFSTDECDALNFSSVNISSFQEVNSSTYNSNIEEANDDTSFIMSLYQISYTLYGVTNTIVCVLLSVVVSYITGNLKSHEVSPKYVSPHVHKFFWTKEELDAIRQKELNLDDGVTEDLNNQPLNFSMKINDNDLETN